MKYKNTFESKNFVLKFEVDEDDASVYLINKAAFLCCVADNLDIFHNLLGSHITPEGLLESFVQNGRHFNNLVNNSSILEGILLGYGKHNSLLYKRSSEISVALKSSVPPPWKEKRDLGKEQLSIEKKLHIYINETKKINPAEGNLKVVPREGFPNLVEEYEWLDAKFDKGADLSPFRDLSRFPFPNFLKDGENEESVQIINDYIDTKKKMGEIYASGDFLTITLKKIMGEI